VEWFLAGVPQCSRKQQIWASHIYTTPHLARARSPLLAARTDLYFLHIINRVLINQFYCNPRTPFNTNLSTVHPRWRIEETDVETDSTKFDSPSARASDIQSKGNARDVGNGESHEQAHLSSGALPAHLTLSESDDRMTAQSVARVGGNGEWGIHGITGKEVIGGELYYCVDWEPMMIRSNELLRAQHLVREFEKKE
jgi:hypothetical protein